MTYLWLDGDPLTVELNSNGQPSRLRWHGKVHTVSKIATRWRIDEGWWLERIWREYYKLTTDTGLLLTLFRNISDDKWFVQRLYD